MVELQLINYILDVKDYSVVTENALKDDMFVEYTNEFRFIMQHYSKYKVVPDTLTFLDSFPDFEIIEVKEPEEFLINKLYEEFQFRNAVPELNKAYKLTQEDSNRGLEYLESILPRLRYRASVKSTSLVKNAQKRLERYKERALNPLKNYITTGFTELDAITGGWDREEDYGLIVARPGKGKTWVLLKAALSAAKAGFKCLLYSGEMGDNMVGYRIDTLDCGISNYKLTHSDPSIMVEYEKHIQEFAKMDGDIITVTPEDLGGFLTASKLVSLIEKYKPDIVFLDQISLMDDDRKGKSEPERVSNISKDIKVIQSEKRIPIIAVSQLNREDTEQSGPDTKNISNSDRLGQDATFVLFVDQKNKETLTLRIIKARYSSFGDKLSYRWKIDAGELEYVPAENDSSPTNKEDTTKLRDKFNSDKRKDNVF